MHRLAGHDPPAQQLVISLNAGTDDLERVVMLTTGSMTFKNFRSLLNHAVKLSDRVRMVIFQRHHCDGGHMETDLRRIHQSDRGLNDTRFFQPAHTPPTR